MLDTWGGGWDNGSACWALQREAEIVDLHVGHLGGRLEWICMLDTWAGGWDSGSSCEGTMLDTWEAGIVDLHVGGWDIGFSCWALGWEAGVVELHVGQLGGRLG